jgi:photosystem II stability/assembly factor-like uncharacterized protein
MKTFFLSLLGALILCTGANAQLNLQWQDLGPDNLGANVHGLIIDNRDSTRQTLYAGVMGGGIWKTTDGAATWRFLGCLDNYAISCMHQASDGTIYIGTGDGIAGTYGVFPSAGHIGNGIYKLGPSDVIIHLNSTTSNGYGNLWSIVNRIAINPTNSNQLIAATANGLYKSADGGTTWNAITIQNISDGTNFTDVKWSADGVKVFADAGLGASSLVRSLDGGVSWNQLTPGSEPGYPAGSLSRIEIAIAPSNSNVVYMNIATGDEFRGVYESINAGNTWDTIVLGRTGFQPLGFQATYNDAISVSPADSSKIYFGGVSMYTYSPTTGVHQLPDYIFPDELAGYYEEQFLYIINDLNPDEVYMAADKGVFKATDALSNFTGAQFYAKNQNLNARNFFSVAADRNGRVMGGSNDAGGLLIGNIGNKDFTDLNIGYGFCDFSRLDTNYAFMENYYAGIYESNNNLGSFISALDSNIDPLAQGGATACQQINIESDAPWIAPLFLHETKTAFATCDSVPYIALTNQNAGSTITAISATANISFPYILTNPVSAGDTIMVPDPVQSNLFLATSCGVWMKRHAIGRVSRDWYHLPGGANCFAVTSDGNKVYYGTSNGSVQSLTGLNLAHYTNDQMVDSFQIVSKAVTGNRTVESIAIDPDNDSILLITVGGFDTLPKAYKSRDAGNTWEALHIGVKGTPVYSCVIDANNSNNYIVGTEQGIWTSGDSGATWHQDDANMCNVPVYQVRQIPLLSDDCYVLYAATNSRGLWRSYTLTPQDCNISVGIHTPVGNTDFAIYPNPATSYTTVEFTLTQTQEVTIQVHDITGRLVQTLQRELPAGDAKIELNTSALHAGTYLISAETAGAVKTKLLVIGK